MEHLQDKINESSEYLVKNGFHDAEIGIILGTGLGSLLSDIRVEKTIPYNKIPYFPSATVEFHKGQLLWGTAGNKKIVVMQGRFHYYEGYSMQQITFPVRVMKTLGVTNLLLSNAAGGINRDFKKTDLVAIEDHINLLPENPLRGLNDPAFGNRFVDMSCPYNDALNKKLSVVAASLSITLKKGVYAAVPGPNLETRAEYRYLKTIGADMVGMSTVPEVIVANHMGMACAAISVITDECDPDNLKPVDINEIIRVAGNADSILSRLLLAVIPVI
ncbi:MAG: purine-nucleoside phosphorylase [Ginsengibacter sp.]